MKKLFIATIMSLALNSIAGDLNDSPRALVKGSNPSKISHQPNLNTIDELKDGAFSPGELSQFKESVRIDESSSTRSAQDTFLFKKISPSVVLIMAKEGKGFKTGTGTLIEDDGTILTNYHVVAGRKEVGVFFKPEKDIQKISNADFRLAKVIKVDQIADLALIKVSSVPPGRAKVGLGDVSDIVIGADVRAIGHPEGQNWSYTKGIISQYRQDFKWLNNSADVIQTQTPINPGNSGGPLLTEKGVIIGVNSFLQQGSEGLNFAVSVEDVKKFIARTGDRLGSQTEKSKKLASKPSKKCKEKVLYSGKSKDGTADILLVDSTCSGKADLLFTYPNDTSKPYILEIDSDADGNADAEFFSFGRNDKWDVSYWDTDFDGKYDQVGIHPDGKIKPSKFVPYDQFMADLENSSSSNPSEQASTSPKTDFHGFAAVHLDDKGPGFGWAVGFKSKDDAEKASSDICYQNGAIGQCKLMGSGAFKCVAIAESSKWRQVASGSSLLDAENTAVTLCDKHGAKCSVYKDKSACSSW